MIGVHLNLKVVMMVTLSPTVALTVFIITTSSATSDDKVGIMTILKFQIRSFIYSQRSQHIVQRLIPDQDEDQFHKSHSAPVPYPTMLYWEQKCVYHKHFMRWMSGVSFMKIPWQEHHKNTVTDGETDWKTDNDN